MTCALTGAVVAGRACAPGRRPPAPPVWSAVGSPGVDGQGERLGRRRWRRFCFRAGARPRWAPIGYGPLPTHHVTRRPPACTLSVRLWSLYVTRQRTAHPRSDPDSGQHAPQHPRLRYRLGDGYAAGSGNPWRGCCRLCPAVPRRALQGGDIDGVRHARLVGRHGTGPRPAGGCNVPVLILGLLAGRGAP